MLVIVMIIIITIITSSYYRNLLQLDFRKLAGGLKKAS